MEQIPNAISHFSAVHECDKRNDRNYCRRSLLQRSVARGFLRALGVVIYGPWRHLVIEYSVYSYFLTTGDIVMVCMIHLIAYIWNCDRCRGKVGPVSWWVAVTCRHSFINVKHTAAGTTYFGSVNRPIHVGLLSVFKWRIYVNAEFGSAVRNQKLKIRTKIIVLKTGCVA